MSTLIGALTSGSLIVLLVGGIRWYFTTRDKPLSKPMLRWIIYILAAISTVVVSLVSKEINFATPETWINTLLAMTGAAEGLYVLVTGKLNLRKAS